MSSRSQHRDGRGTPSSTLAPDSTSVAAASDRLTDFAKRGNARLAGIFQRWRRDVPEAPGPATAADVFDAVAEMTLRGGKRLRAALAYHAGQCFNSTVEAESLLDASLSLELLQTALLIHDDIMDRDDSRRGGPTVHLSMSERLGDAHLGSSMAIMAGSLGLALAQRLVLEAGLSPTATVRAARELADMQEVVIYGQTLDVIGAAPPAQIQSLKTSSYTTVGPLRFGASVVEAPGAGVAALEAYGGPLGRAFQTRDDLLGVFGDTRRLGKPVGADLREGKQTELVLSALERASAAQRLAIESVLGRSDATHDAIARACDAIEATGARAAMQTLVEENTAAAIQALSDAPLEPAGRDFLVGIAHLLAYRAS